MEACRFRPQLPNAFAFACELVAGSDTRRSRAKISTAAPIVELRCESCCQRGCWDCDGGARKTSPCAKTCCPTADARCGRVADAKECETGSANAAGGAKCIVPNDATFPLCTGVTGTTTLRRRRRWSRDSPSFKGVSGTEEPFIALVGGAGRGCALIRPGLGVGGILSHESAVSASMEPKDAGSSTSITSWATTGRGAGASMPFLVARARAGVASSAGVESPLGRAPRRRRRANTKRHTRHKRKSKLTAAVPATRLSWDGGNPPPQAVVNEGVVCVAVDVGNGVALGDAEPLGVADWLGVRVPPTLVTCADVLVGERVDNWVIDCDTECVVDAACIELSVGNAERELDPLGEKV